MRVLIARRTRRILLGFDHQPAAIAVVMEDFLYNTLQIRSGVFANDTILLRKTKLIVEC